jgi:hypothetical protein
LRKRFFSLLRYLKGEIYGCLLLAPHFFVAIFRGMASRRVLSFVDEKKIRVDKNQEGFETRETANF